MSEQTASTEPVPQNVTVRLANSPSEILAAQKLRYKVFYEECGAIPGNLAALEKRDFDQYDDIADHLIALDMSRDQGDQIVGTYRLIRQDRIPTGQHFYSSDEFNIMPLLTCGGKLLELGRSCILPEYRNRPMLQRMWQGIIDYVCEHNIDLMFGSAIFHGTDVDAISKQLAYLYHYHKAPPALCPTGLPGRCVDMNLYPKDALDQRKVFQSLPPLIKGYLRLGCMIGDGAYIDRQFNSIDVCIVMPTYSLADKYTRHWERGGDQPVRKKSAFAESLPHIMSREKIAS